MTRTAAALVIGNEVLTGKVQEANVAVLARTLFQLGIALRRVIVCTDEVGVIAADLNALRASHDFVFTSGGVGPTHDDVTVEGVAAAFGRDVVRSGEVEALLRAHHSQRNIGITDAHLRMADIVQGARLIRSAALPWPTLVVENVYVLPGVPEIFRMKLDVLRLELESGESFRSRAVYTRCDEGQIAAALHELALAHPSVLVGSYLAWKEPTYKVKITFDGLDHASVDAATEEFAAGVSEDDLVRVE